MAAVAHTPRWHAGGWILAFLLSFSQPWGRTAADTKLDLIVDPIHFLSQALHAYTDTFTLGQLQNQAYGYLFPHGAFFAATQFLPDWVAQRLWWTLVLGIGYSGALTVARRAGLASLPAAVAAAAYALSPRVLTTLTAISSETWPVMLAPWVVAPLLRSEVRRHEVAAAILPVALMGAVNATATLAACGPAAVVLLYRRAWRPLAGWLAGCAAVSLWWLGPLLILGKFAPPFTDYIESSYVTTRWLNLTEILRGTTSWSPFVEDERTTGFLLATGPTFVLLTALVAAVGLAGLVRAPRLWTVMLLAGVGLLGCHLAVWVDFLDGAGAALRNVHKFDPLVRLPLSLGVGFALARLWQPQAATPARKAAAVLAVLLVAASASPAATGRLLPRGTWEEIPQEWSQAANFLNTHAQGTRTLIIPERSFAREEWGWTRDEPLQPLLDVPWAVRDAIPLVPPEAIRGLDGVMEALREGRVEAVKRLGIGALVVRTDDALRPLADVGEHHSFGDLTVILLPERPDLLLTADAPVRVAGGGEALAFVDGPAQLVDADADIVTDTPLLVDRNFGTLTGPVSAPLAESDPTHVRNRYRDYASAGTPVTVVADGGHVAASSSAADSSALGGANPARSVTAAVDGHNDTAWWPAPGDRGWLEFQAPAGARFPARSALTLRATDATTVTVSSQGASVDVLLPADQDKTITVPGGASDAIRITLTQRVGLNAQLPDTPLTRVVTVPDTSPDVQEFRFRQQSGDTGWLIRDFTAPRDMDVTVDTHGWVTIDGEDYHHKATVHLTAGRHRLETKSVAVALRTAAARAGSYTPTGRDLAATDTDRLLVTGRAANAGLEATLDGVPLEPVTVDAATQAFHVPAGASGHVSIRFAADAVYRAVLIGGAVLALLTAAGCLWLLSLPRRRCTADAHDEIVADPHGDGEPGGAGWAFTAYAGAALALAGWPALAGGVAGWAAARWTALRPEWLAGLLFTASGAMLARGPWGSGTYAGDVWLTGFFAAAALGACACRRVSQRAAGASTQ